MGLPQAALCCSAMEELLLPLKRPIKATVKDQQAGLGALGCRAGKGEGGVG